MLVAISGADQPLGDAAHHGRVLALQRFEVIFETAARRQTDDRRQVESDDVGGADLPRRAEDSADHGLDGIRHCGPIRERLQCHHHEARVRLADCVEEGVADHRESMGDLRQLQQHIFQALHGFTGARHRRAVRQLNHDEEGALILFRQKACRRAQRSEIDTDREAADDQQADHAEPDEPPDDGRIAVARPVDAAEHPAHDAAFMAALAGPKKDAAEGGRESQGIDSRDHHGDADGHGALPEQDAGQAGYEGDRHENRKQHQGDGDDRRRDFGHGPFGRLRRGEFRMLLHDAFDILDHHDGVVDHDADRQHHGQQRHRIGGISDDQQHREGPDQADRHCDGRDDGGAQAAKEQEHHDDDQHEGFADRLQHLADRVVHEGGRIVNSPISQPLGKTRRQLGQGRVHGGRGFHGIGARRQINGDRHRRLAVEPAEIILVLCAHLDASHISHPNDGSIRVGAHHEGAELLRRRQRPFGLHIKLKLLVIADGPGADPADRRLDIDDVDDLGRRHIEAVEALDVEPYPHGIFELAEERSLASSE